MKRFFENDSLLIALGIALLGFAGWACGSAEPAISPELKDRIPTNARNIIVTSSQSADELFEAAKNEIENNTPCEIRTIQEDSRRILTEECTPGQSPASLRIDLRVEETSDGSRADAITQVQLGSRDSWQDVQYDRKGGTWPLEEAAIIMNNLPGEISFETP
jgi:hypothetical protein